MVLYYPWKASFICRKLNQKIRGQIVLEFQKRYSFGSCGKRKSNKNLFSPIVTIPPKNVFISNILGYGLSSTVSYKNTLV
jgi:hypothetical protein